jgi:hypothetical protein
MSSRAPNESDRVDAIVRLLGGLADGHDLFEVAAANGVRGELKEAIYGVMIRRVMIRNYRKCL